MGIGTMFKSFFSSNALGKQTIDTIMDAYIRAQKQQPNEEPHAWLASAWLGRMKARGKNINDENLHIIAFSETYLSACVKPPLCARCLGLYILYKETPHVLEANPHFIQEYEDLMRPVLEAQENGTFGELYEKYNPNMAEAFIEED